MSRFMFERNVCPFSLEGTGISCFSDCPLFVLWVEESAGGAGLTSVSGKNNAVSNAVPPVNMAMKYRFALHPSQTCKAPPIIGAIKGPIRVPR